MDKTTYQHDFNYPNTKRSDFLEDSQRNQCLNKFECHEYIPQCETYQNSDSWDKPPWVGMPSGQQLISPRIQKQKYSPAQLKGFAHYQCECTKNEPNRFLKTINETYPSLYKRIKQQHHDNSEYIRKLKNLPFPWRINPDKDNSE